MSSLESVLREFGVLPVVKIENADDAQSLAEALIRGGLPCAEITFRTDAAEEAIRKIKEKYPDFFVAAGTVLTVENVKKAVQAGASLIVAPAFNPEIVNYCLKNNIPVIPGVATPSEIDAAYTAGLETVKFFPAEAMGGLKYLKAVAAPYFMMKFMPTGGINVNNLKDYLGFGKVVCCGGSWIAPSGMIASHDFEGITKLAAEAVAAVKEALK
ncbi:MAG: bifunctional 4-hydroxy-2-oxoglutarate aldolase/2-dehydro-3-deoxy-phosphogluconate aldolase [Clostridia bacterium]|nr:bifunctional 4-hydroxy-2-oxoglutarate aldolase/2-dehydro-3-deoxy-phosphogluconate aldolase [Clostridia bacterium]MBO7398008.1 bifunctional 4-hydroxy-2-oxoglutarate aldolase/2-dehydro-3-deoxy-phosphogluconate aldolase [Clostridia bacterium]MBO7503832.1 bifunctional 4-hydroxy-2-oxoglutarate aldolase/2-dehydro-3-deoxy-phosphogluconate aldolase [Clostridia bacterium]MBO7658525.1 bifunctional 4-hydroxy-2-oxoglutarate aldolase/2-dehydro-3-deoxy-phosphogluconate aldolase [Clostridia bacterium]MBP56